MAVSLDEAARTQGRNARAAVEQMQIVARHQENITPVSFNDWKAVDFSEQVTIADIVIGNQVAF